MLQSKAIEKAVSKLSDGGVILYPTDTIWALGCDPWSAEAVQRIYDIKKRSRDEPLLLLVSSIDELKKYVTGMHPRVETLLSYHERPLTLIHPKARNLPEHLLAENGSIGIRVVSQGLCHDLIKAFGRPVVGTTPNEEEETIPTNFGSISSKIIGKCDFVLMTEEEARSESRPSVVATYDKKGELSFIRT